MTRNETILLIFISVLLISGVAIAAEEPTRHSASAFKSPVMRFEPNLGQTEAQVHPQCRVHSRSYTATPNAAAAMQSQTHLQTQPLDVEFGALYLQ